MFFWAEYWCLVSLASISLVNGQADISVLKGPPRLYLRLIICVEISDFLTEFSHFIKVKVLWQEFRTVWK